MTNEIRAVQKKGCLRRVFRVLAIGCLLVIVVGVLAHFAWKYSGSNEWKQKINKNGIEVYSRKSPGSTLTDIKVARNLKMSQGVAMMALVDVDCREWLPGACTGRNIEPYDLKDQAETDFFVGEFPYHLSPREWLFKTQFSEDPRTHAILMEVTAVPDLLPRNECCYRVTTLHNRWLLTPLGDGEMRIEFEMHTDEGLPYFLVNPLKPGAVYKLFADLPRQFGKKKYQNAEPESWKKYLLSQDATPQH
jgi:hypothetical protein